MDLDSSARSLKCTLVPKSMHSAASRRVWPGIHQVGPKIIFCPQDSKLSRTVIKVSYIVYIGVVSEKTAKYEKNLDVCTEKSARNRP
jgi:hypothetical protein